MRTNQEPLKSTSVATKNPPRPVSELPAETPALTVLEWQSEERRPKRRWYWWPIYLWIVFFCAYLAFDLASDVAGYSFAVLIVVIGLWGILAPYSRNKVTRYRLDGKTLTIGNASKEKAVDLGECRYAAIDDTWSTPDAPTVRLVEKKTFSFETYIGFPSDDTRINAILDALEAHVPVVKDPYPPIVSRLFRSVARWVGLQ